MCLCIPGGWDKTDTGVKMQSEPSPNYGYMRGTPLAVTADTEEGTLIHKLFCVHKKKMHAPLEGLKNIFLQYHSISTNLNCITVLS